MASEAEAVADSQTKDSPDNETTVSECGQDLLQPEGEFGSSFGMHLKRQAQLCKLALQNKYKYLPESVSLIGDAFEESIFNPVDTDQKAREARMNFYPPFAIPECTACYSSFFSVLSVPLSCSANRTGTKKLNELRHKDKFDLLPRFDSGMFVIADGLGSEVTATDALPRKTRLVNIDLDNDRLSNLKQKLRYVTHFAYPALNLPPKLYKELVTCLIKPVQSTETAEAEQTGQGSEYAIPDDVFFEVIGTVKSEVSLEQQLLEFRCDMIKALQYVLPLKLMQDVFRTPAMVKKLQETLHYTFHHGYIRLIGEITKKNLSNYITFHSMTFENKNNNPMLHTTLDLIDGEDYIVDSIFLILVLTWQTLMGIWQQNLNDENIEMLRNLLKNRKYELIGKTVDEIADQVSQWITDEGRLTKIFHDFAPDFTSQAQVMNFRQFILARSNIVAGMVPALIKDFIPLDYLESPLRLWNHVYLLQLSYFLYNHGDYYQIFFHTDADTKASENEAWCYCNLCSPHRMPVFNPALHNEILAIDSFDLVIPSPTSKMGERIKLTAGMWATKYLNHFVAKEFFPFEVKKYLDYPEIFTETPTACIITKPKVLSAIRALQRQREKFLLEKGSGTYLDPETGDVLSDAKLLSQPSERKGPHTSSGDRGEKGKEKEKKKNTR